MACIKRKVLEDGCITYRIQVKAKNERTGKFEAKVMTWRKPPELNEKQVQREVNRVAVEFEDKFRKQMSGLLATDNDVTFMEYANKWLERIKRTQSLNYYTRAIDSLRKYEEYFGQVKLKNMTPAMIQGFIDELCNTPSKRHSAKLVGDIERVIKRSFYKQKEICENSGVSRSIIFSAKSGHNITMENAKRICETLNVKYEELFTTVTEEHFYAKETISKHKRVLHTILANAKRERLIEHNFASRDYILPIRGEKKEVRILNDKEAKLLVKALETEENPKWKHSLLISLFMGIRRGELAGLEWQDIDFENKTMKIQRSVQDIPRYGLITKEPKTENSKRVISMPDKLISYLKEYKTYWDKEKEYYGDRWKDNNRLFANEDGQTISPGLFRVWLQKILFRAGLPIVTLHSLRHTNITLQLIAGVDMKTVSARAGHARASTTSDFYSHFITNSDIHASEIINKIFEE